MQKNDSDANNTNSMRMLRIKKGYTLLELLVVIGIISILIGLGAVSYSTTQKKSRDARRKGDLKAIQNAFEQYYSINSFQYPTLAVGNISGSLTSGSVTLITYPTDPTGGYYQCVNACSVSVYTIQTTLETESPANYTLNNQQ